MSLSDARNLLLACVFMAVVTMAARRGLDYLWGDATDYHGLAFFGALMATVPIALHFQDRSRRSKQQRRSRDG